MRPTKPKDFDREAPKIARVAGAARAPQQLSLDEQLPGQVHGWAPYIIGDYGYRRPCACGWPGEERATKRATDVEMRRHIGRTPQGSILERTFRKYGRGGSGA